MRCFKEYDKNGYIFAIGIGDALNGIEITKEEYEVLLSDMETKMDYIERFYRQEIGINDIPVEWQEEIQFRVDEMIEIFGPYQNQLTNEEIDTIILGGVIE